MKKLLFLFDTDPYASVFDTVVAYDGGADRVTGYANVTPENVGALVDGTIYTRGGKDKQSTAIFVGGGDMPKGEAVLAAIKKRFFGPFRVSVMLDSNGSNTTAAAGVALLAKAKKLKGKKAVVLAGTGPVGMRAAAFLGQEGADVTITSRTKDKGEQAAKAIEQRFNVKVKAVEGADDKTRAEAVKDANIVFAAGAIGYPAPAALGLEGQSEYSAHGRRERPAAARHRGHRGDRQGQGAQRQDRVRRARHRRAETQAAPGLHRQAVRELGRRVRRRGDLRAGKRDGLMTQIKEKAVDDFLDALASSSATPGGGSAAAILGAMGAALVSMVCNLTIGKKKYADVEGEMKDVLGKAEALRHKLTGMIQDDVKAFDMVMGAYGMAKETDAEKAAREKAIQAALKQATEVPLACARVAREVIELAGIAADKGNLNVISDAGVGVLAGYAALRSAALNVFTNARMITDKTFAEAKLKELNELLAGAEGATERAYGVVKNKVS